MNFKIIFLFASIIFSNILAQEIELYKTNVKVWGVEQQIQGRLVDFNADSGILYLNNTQINFSIPDQENFNIPIVLNEGSNVLYVTVMNGVNPINSDTIMLSLGYNIKPTLFAYAEASSQSVTLYADVTDNPDSSIISFQWSSDPTNPVQTTLANPNDTICSVSFNNQPIDGEYYFNLVGVTNHNDTIKVRTFVTINGNEIKPFNILTDHAAWIDSAIIYEITPYNFVNPSGNFKQIKKKIPDFVRLGVNTLWIQPVYKTANGGQGYDVIDYFNIREDYGTEQDLRDLIADAKNNNLRVIFDFVANHSSILHPYALHSTQNSENSHYWNYYQREVDNVPYSQHYSFYNGFINYFWDQLPNLNYNNPEVEKWMSEAIKYWVENFDIDGYRFDAIWGTNARKPQFMKDVRIMLKSLKPEVLMLAEDKATWASTFDQNFDLAFDWYPEEDWVSHWTWQTNYSSTSNPTIFNTSSIMVRQQLLRDALTNRGSGFAPNAKILRFMGNNDIFHFITHHGLERTKMAAALLFTLHGVPMIYNGQEIGKDGHPYTTEFLFYPGRPIDYDDQYGLFPYYQRLIEIRKNYHALIGNNFEELSIEPGNFSFAFRRWNEEQNIITVMNMKSVPSELTISLPIQEMNLDTTKTYYLTELISGEVISGSVNEIQNFTTSMNKYHSKIFSLADTAAVVTGINEQIVSEMVPKNFSMKQNYPNPFNPSTIIEYTIPSNGIVELSVFNVLGEKVITLVNETLSSGEYSVKFNAGNLSSGAYFARLTYENKSIVKKMFLVK